MLRLVLDVGAEMNFQIKVHPLSAIHKPLALQ